MFKKGDIVVCIEPTTYNNVLKLGEKYTIEYIFDDNTIKIKHLNRGGFFANRFMLLTEYRRLKIRRLYENKKRICK